MPSTNSKIEKVVIHFRPEDETFVTSFLTANYIFDVEENERVEKFYGKTLVSNLKIRACGELFKLDVDSELEILKMFLKYCTMDYIWLKFLADCAFEIRFTLPVGEKFRFLGQNEFFEGSVKFYISIFNATSSVRNMIEEKIKEQSLSQIPFLAIKMPENVDRYFNMLTAEADNLKIAVKCKKTLLVEKRSCTEWMFQEMEEVDFDHLSFATCFAKIDTEIAEKNEIIEKSIESLCIIHTSLEQEPTEAGADWIVPQERSDAPPR